MDTPSILRRLFMPWACGALAGACQGTEGCWPLACLALAAALCAWAHPNLQPRQAALGYGLFWGGAATAASACAFAGLPAELHGPTLAPWAAGLAAHGLLAAAAAAVTTAATGHPVWRLTVALPAATVLAEFLMSQGPWASPWVRLAHIGGAESPFAGWLPWGGSLLAGAIMLSACGALALAMNSSRSRRQRRALILALGTTGLSAVAGTPEWTSPASPLRLVLAQPGLGIHADADDATLRRLMHFYLGAAGQASSGLMLTPELALPRMGEALPPGYLDALDRALRDRGADGWLGLYLAAGAADSSATAGPEPSPPGAGGPRVHNAIQALGVSGPQQHRKQHLVPWVEHEPWPGLAWPAPQPAPTGPRGRSPRSRVAPSEGPAEPLVVPGGRAAPALCFELAFGQTLRDRAQQAQLLVAMTSDSNLSTQLPLRQSLQIASLRALELQKPVARISDVAGTRLIDHRGITRARATDGQAQWLVATANLRTGSTPYARIGDAGPTSLALGLLVALRIGRHGRKRAAQPRPSRRGLAAGQRGQVLPAAVALMLVMAGIFYFMVNTSQTATEKIRATNAADAAAYSVGTLEARALNYHAYTNRAMVANQIAIAQMVSLASWVDYFATAADNWASHAETAHLFVLPDPKVLSLDGAFFGMNIVSYYTGTTAQEYANYINEYGIPAIVTVHNAVAEALSASQQLVSLNLAAGLRQRQIANDVVKAMDPALTAEVVASSHGFDHFTRRYSRNGEHGDERGRMADVVMRSRDEFTRERNWTARGIDLPFIRRDGALRKRAGTELIGYDEWRAMDTLELHGRVWGCGKFGLSWCPDLAQPVGWGAVAVGTSDSGARGHHGGAYDDNANTADQAEGNMRRPTYAWYSGIQEAQELRDPADEAAQRTGVSIRVTKPHAALLTSGGAAQARPAGELALFGDRPAGAELAALSRAEVYFDRVAARADGKDERASLYNPYWRVRLVAPTAGDRAWSAARQQGVSLP